ncbi:oligopeptide-binding protein AppA precursor [Clostridium tepidiprofundi DSM 19306]|uniref:Oligopeptide-binding protein AppA n=1 Tax=Clostridium tepidiprofundi DSM 19306 TaxID=1121338 RepID=A0A151B2Q9_9CLOT|nr:ABC transporter substrate-binding protein [Clostridium tepidiprofundi]KYH34219.1 oligopeptide-binding protein AppA precursor [Clostridium tepidiprofundi DSM 19306]
MKKTKMLSLALIGLISLGLASCGQSNTKVSKNTENPKVVASQQKTDKQITSTKEVKIKDGGTMIFVSSSDPTVLNPYYQNNRITFTVNNALFNPLFVIDGDNIRYYLAEKVDVLKDNLTYRVKLKDNLKWHDGKKITVDDIIFSINAALDKKQHMAARDSFIIDGKPIELKKIDDLTLEIKLPKIYVPFMETLGSIRPIPKHIFEGVNDIEKSDKNNNPIGSGPYKLKEWKKGEYIALERFDDYYNGKPHIKEIVYRIAGDKNSQKIAFENGEINAMYIGEKTFNKYSKDSRFKTYTYDECMPNYLGFNFKNKYLRKKEIRQAICYAIDKKKLLKSSFSSLENVKDAYSVFPPSTLYYTDDVEHYNYNLEKAKELMKKSGVSNIKLKFIYMASSPLDINQMSSIQEDLKKIGIEVQPVPLEAQAFYDQLFNESARNFDLVINAYVCGTDPDSYSELFTENGSENWFSYANKDLDKLWDKGAIETNPSKRREIYETIQKKLAEDAVQFNINYSTTCIAISSNIGGVEEAKTVPIFMFEDLSKLYFIEK